MKPLNVFTFDDAAIQAVVSRKPVVYTMKSSDLPDYDFRMSGLRICVWPDGQLDVVGNA